MITYLVHINIYCGEWLIKQMFLPGPYNKQADAVADAKSKLRENTFGSEYAIIAVSQYRGDLHHSTKYERLMLQK